MTSTYNVANVSRPRSVIVRSLLRGAWLGALLGLFIEALVLLVQLLQGVLPETVTLIADTVQKISWSSLICAILAAGQSAARGRITSAGVIGLVGAPISFLLARSLHKAMLELLGKESATTAIAWLGAGIKGIEYALLGAILLWLADRGAGWKLHACAGALVGLAAYALVLWWLPAGGDPVQRAIIEIVHPIGCALAVHAAATFGQHLGSGKDA